MRTLGNIKSEVPMCVQVLLVLILQSKGAEVIKCLHIKNVSLQ